MTWREAMMLAYDGGVVCLVAAAVLSLQRRGARGWGQALAPAALAQVAGAVGRLGMPLTPVLAWVWLLQTAANVALIYSLWQAGGREASRRAEAEEGVAVLDLRRVRALASRPGRSRSG